MWYVVALKRKEERAEEGIWRCKRERTKKQERYTGESRSGMKPTINPKSTTHKTKEKAKAKRQKCSKRKTLQ